MFYYHVNYGKKSMVIGFVLQSGMPLLKKDIKAACKKSGLAYRDSREISLNEPVHDHYSIIDGSIHAASLRGGTPVPVLRQA